MALKIYTKTGDKGTTSLIGGTKVSKANMRIDAYGTVDELNSWVGYVNDQLEIAAAKKTMQEIQDRLFTIGAALACDPDKEPLLKTPDLKNEDIIFLEKEIDNMYKDLPPMKSFILPGGHPIVSSAHIARCVCRRAERIIVAMQENKMPVEPLIIQYLNRLSDYLFALARYCSHYLKVAEIPWRPRL
ncbi:MAG: cob(I)yrinic acid a,c-diamide adenosyltransferase [Chitinophagaceae bacterium]|nr:cob(I)yrinic acid a,c-diamide adenosyltransferase [Chitinophagaceae bacterium]MCB0741065.1 cob(I)yrinic acid a,c-diamide adenosyltransferase [Chitinophagaceae bacterium]HQU57509.1 cob(I)yrinic acid a,c-diamide adenosyltransferase [Chitinophagaceae bacterium]